MASNITKFNSVDGYSVGTGLTTVIDGAGNFFGAGATFTGPVSIGGRSVTGVVSSWNGATGPVYYAPGLASGSITGVASFGYGLAVSNLGEVSLTSSYVTSVNGQTGAVTVLGGGSPPPLASASLTGVASFGYGLDVSALGAVSLTSSYVSSVNGQTGAVTVLGGGSPPPLATSTITGVASFGYGLAVSNLGAVSLTSSYVMAFNGITGAPSLTATSASNVTLTIQGTNIFVALGISSGTADPSGGTDGNIYLQFTV